MPTITAKEQFDRQAAHYNAQWNSWSERALAWMVENAECKPTDRLLDVATGTGYTAIEFAPHVGSVVAVDVSSGMLEQDRRRAEERRVNNISFRESPAEKLPFDGASFDIVTCRLAAHHFLKVSAFAAEAARVLRPGGRLIVVDTTVPDDDHVAAEWQIVTETIRDRSHVKNYSPLEWRAIAEGAGLTIVEATDSGNGITIPIDDWMAKAGCDAEQQAELRQRFASAPENVKAAYAITTAPDGGTVFTWRRILLKAVK